ncbi:cobalamin biosynthesis Co2+ chelatase CbiK [Catalinimonas alkaloidigena]|uniref:hypothetical protein n=1 Tax=Catalinimonas alkaloidigena TaxID=1075417 RepID=UPI0024076C93|nr:hypothetical protein [Catalinimonas alkaloidigena]MDF9799896.1 cobalamin biosynthesis Co2+ chelatase CbiK [Catalinimonas alkaloidigena]
MCWSEDKITASDFYQNYLHSDAQVIEKDAELKPINASELPSKVMESFANSPFGKHTISQVYLIPAKETSDLISQIVSYSLQDTSEETYLLSLKGKEVETQLRFSKSGKLIHVISA